LNLQPTFNNCETRSSRGSFFGWMDCARDWAEGEGGLDGKGKIGGSRKIGETQCWRIHWPSTRGACWVICQEKNPQMLFPGLSQSSFLLSGRESSSISYVLLHPWALRVLDSCKCVWLGSGFVRREIWRLALRVADIVRYSFTIQICSSSRITYNPFYVKIIVRYYLCMNFRKSVSMICKSLRISDNSECQYHFSSRNCNFELCLENCTVSSEIDSWHEFRISEARVLRNNGYPEGKSKWSAKTAFSSESLPKNDRFEKGNSLCKEDSLGDLITSLCCHLPTILDR
jgi:hypothetical protein